MYRGDEVYLRAFWELSTERQFGQVVGPIPWSCIVAYGRHVGLDDSMLRVFERVVRSLDEEYLAWLREEQKRKTEQTRPQKKAADA